MPTACRGEVSGRFQPFLTVVSLPASLLNGDDDPCNEDEERGEVDDEGLRTLPAPPDPDVFVTVTPVLVMGADAPLGDVLSRGTARLTSTSRPSRMCFCDNTLLAAEQS